MNSIIQLIYIYTSIYGELRCFDFLDVLGRSNWYHRLTGSRTSPPKKAPHTHTPPVLTVPLLPNSRISRTKKPSQMRLRRCWPLASRCRRRTAHHDGEAYTSSDHTLCGWEHEFQAIQSTRLPAKKQLHLPSSNSVWPDPPHDRGRPAGTARRSTDLWVQIMGHILGCDQQEVHAWWADSSRT
jgi:hypothetical protein